MLWAKEQFGLSQANNDSDSDSVSNVFMQIT